jgi:hypothetical protein
MVGGANMSSAGVGLVIRMPRPHVPSSQGDRAMRHLITGLVFLAALGLYLAGSVAGSVLLFVVGALIEGYGWFRLARSEPPQGRSVS